MLAMPVHFFGVVNVEYLSDDEVGGGDADGFGKDAELASERLAEELEAGRLVVVGFPLAIVVAVEGEPLGEAVGEGFLSECPVVFLLSELEIVEADRPTGHGEFHRKVGQEMAVEVVTAFAQGSDGRAASVYFVLYQGITPMVVGLASGVFVVVETFVL